MVERFEVGVITGTHGLKGEVKIFPAVDYPEFYRNLDKVYLTGGKEEKVLTVNSVKFVGKYVVLGFEDFKTIEEVQKLRTRMIEVDRKDAIPMPDGEYYPQDLIGMTVYDEKDNKVGTLTDVLKTGANDCYEITREGGRTMLIPAIPDCIREVHIEEAVMRIYMMPGLEDL